MFLKHIDLTTALRPSYLPDEVLLFVQDNVGLYEGSVAWQMVQRQEAYKQLCRKYKIPDHQNGHVYLTSHRICYVDNEDPRKHSVAIDLKEIDRFEFYVWSLTPTLLSHSDI
jgi:ESCRT-II complex subunit VPS36